MQVGDSRTIGPVRFTVARFTVGLVILMLMAPSPVFAQDEPVAPQETTNSVDSIPDSVAVEDVVDDSRIARRLQDIYDSSGWFSGMEVSSRNGFVTLSGATESDAHRDWATEIATRTTDVIGVRNRLEVATTVSFAESMSVVGDSLEKQYRGLLVRTPFLIAGLVVLVLTWMASRIVAIAIGKFVDSSESLRSSLKDLIRQLSSISVWILGILIGTVVVFPGMTPARALTVLGLGSVAIGFAFKDIFENFFAGVLILWRYPIEKGDFIECGDVVGKVEQITIRNTMLRRADGELIVVPNGQLFKSNVEVLTNRPKRRVRINCGVGYGENIDDAREVIRRAVANCQSVDGPGSVEVFANNLGSSGVDFEVAWWTGATPLEVRRSRDEVVASIKTSLDESGIEIPFPYRTLTFADSVNAANPAAIPKQSFAEHRNGVPQSN